MHCSHCGFENPVTHRFCGMCGTPLSQQPITAPGAHSTLSFISSTLEVARKTASTLSSQVPSRPAAVEEAPPSGHTTSDTHSVTASAHAPVSADRAASGASEPETEAEPSDLPAAKNYFTDAQEAESLEQFIARFQYTPPAEVEEEVDMTGEKPVLDGSGETQPPAPVGLSEEPAPVSEPPVGLSEEPAPVSEPQVGMEEPVPTEAAAVGSFSLEVPPPFATKSLRGKAAEPPRVLDLSVLPAKDAAGEGASEIQGLSFLGLDALPPVSSSKAESVAPRRRGWVLWVAVIVILSLAAFGFLEWRAETYQINGGPIGILKTQIGRLKSRMNAAGTHAPPTQTAPAAAPANSTPQPNSSGTGMQAAPSSNPHSSSPSNNPAGQSTANPSAPAPH